MPRPDFSDIATEKDFNQWYWTKEELISICKKAQLSFSGSKEDLRQRISQAFNNTYTKDKKNKSKKAASKFNWAKEKLQLSTIITDNVSFGPNFRNFMQANIDRKFSCHSDFMDWVKANIGKTLADAIVQWNILEDRKKDPDFRRKIANHNRLSLYVRDFLEDHPDKSFKDALRLWNIKKQLPVQNGMVKYEKKDIELLS